MTGGTGWLAVTIEARQRISMGRGTGRAFHTDTHDHVPGSVLRGAIARTWLAGGGRTDTTFRDVFDRHLRFGPAFADGTSLRPLSVRYCKYRDNPDHRCGAAATDARPDAGPTRTSWDAAFPVSDGVTLPLDWADPHGHWTGSRGEVVAAPGAAVPVTTVTSTAIDHATGTAAEGRLFSRGAVETGTVLRGLITGEVDALETLTAWLDGHQRFELGGRSSVLGAATIRVHRQPALPPPERDRIVLRTLSPAFLLDEAGRPSLDVAAELRRLGYRGSVERVWTRPVTEGTGGFHAASRLPKAAEVGLAAGTTAVLAPTPGDTAALERLLERGIGVRRPEGFGWIAFTEAPWEEPRPVHAAAEALGDGEGFAGLRRTINEARLTEPQRVWLAQRLTDTPETADAVEEVLRQPAAADLTSTQRESIRDALRRPGHVRRRLADHLREDDAR